MSKINKILILLLSFMLPAFGAKADVATDLASNLPLETVIKNGLRAGLPMSVVLVKVFSWTPENQRLAIVSAAISVSALDAPLVVRTAIRAGVDPEEVVTEAVALAPLERKAITQAAIASGADVVDVTLASAAGIRRSGINLSNSGALGAIPSAPPVFDGGFVAPITPVRVDRGGPVAPPSVGISPS